MTANNNTIKKDKFIKRVAQAIKEEIVDEWTTGEVSGLVSGVLSVAAFLIWLTYSIVTYVRNQEEVTCSGLFGHILGLAFEHLTRMRPNPRANQDRLDRAIHDNDVNANRAARQSIETEV